MKITINGKFANWEEAKKLLENIKEFDKELKKQNPGAEDVEVVLVQERIGNEFSKGEFINGFKKGMSGQTTPEINATPCYSTSHDTCEEHQA